MCGSEIDDGEPIANPVAPMPETASNNRSRRIPGIVIGSLVAAAVLAFGGMYAFADGVARH